MSNDGTSAPLDRQPDQSPPTPSQPAPGNASDGAVLPHSNGNSTNDNGAQQNGIAHRLRLNPNADHKPDNYEDLNLDFSPFLFSSLERYLPPNMLSLSRDVKVTYMRDILLRYSPESERIRLQKHREYRQKIISNYQRLHRELYTMHATTFFVPSFLKAINENTEQGFRNIMSEPTPGIFTFEMLQPRFCEMLLTEVENFEKWVHETKFRIMRPNTMNKYGAVLDDFGMETMLDKVMEEYIRPISKVFFPEVGGSTLDAHHGFVVEYGMDRDLDLGFHVDDSEVTLNVCLGKQFSGGELFFRGVRCEKHVNTETQSEEIFDYSHVPGRAVLHRGRHRHGARATTSGNRINLLLWCRSSVFRELRKYQKDFSSWCAECQREKKERQHQSVSAAKLWRTFAPWCNSLEMVLSKFSVLNGTSSFYVTSGWKMVLRYVLASLLLGVSHERHTNELFNFTPTHSYSEISSFPTSNNDAPSYSSLSTLSTNNSLLEQTYSSSLPEK